MNIQQALDDLRLIQMRALTHEDDLKHYHVLYYGHRIAVQNEFGSGWNFFADEHTDNPAYQTLLCIKRLEDDLNKPDLRIAVRTYKAATADMDYP